MEDYGSKRWVAANPFDCLLTIADCGDEGARGLGGFGCRLYGGSAATGVPAVYVRDLLRGREVVSGHAAEERAPSGGAASIF